MVKDKNKKKSNNYCAVIKNSNMLKNLFFLSSFFLSHRNIFVPGILMQIEISLVTARYSPSLTLKKMPERIKVVQSQRGTQ